MSIVIPLFNESKTLPQLILALQKLKKILKDQKVEFVLVNDGSRDSTSDLLFEFAQIDPNAKIIELSRNFGHQIALTAGLDHASGEAVVIMDGDLQDPIELVPLMIDKYLEGFDVVYAQRISRQGESFFKRVTASGFYWFMKRFVFADLPQNVGEFRLMSNEAKTAFLKLRERDRFIRGMVTWIGFSQTGIPFERPPRKSGESKYSLKKMLKLAWTAVTSFSGIPPRLGLILGVPTTLLASIIGLWHVIEITSQNKPVSPIAALSVLVAFLGGALLICLGIIGDYVGRIFDEIRGRPLYLVQRKLNFEVVRELQVISPAQQSPSTKAKTNT